MAQSEGVTESVEAVQFSFMTDEDVRKHSVLKVTNPNLLDSVGRPLPGGLYDPAMGPLEEMTPCKTCGLRSVNCPGHCGHIDLILPVYNPLLFNILYNLLQRTCFSCFHFRAGREEVMKCISQLELITKGDVVGAKELDLDSLSQSSYSEECNRSKCQNAELKQQPWTSLQFTEAMSFMNKFLKPKFKKCQNCGARNPSFTRPTFGWLYKSMADANIRANIIRGINLEGHREASLSEEEVINSSPPWGNDVDTDKSDAFAGPSPGSKSTTRKSHRTKGSKVPNEYFKQKKSLLEPFLPSEAKEILRHLWENEAQLCSRISSIQHQEFLKKEGYRMFFLETILVPPIKFRPPSKGGDSVMEHPQTVLLTKVLQSNIDLGNAHVNDLGRAKIVSRWLGLQQSINVMFDSKTAAGQRDAATGICQLLEKKEGIFRQKMMGKRVNYACRSVISPDPYLAVNEIGIPPYFALRLTYPERVTPWNVGKLRDAIINGSEIHPGATHYVDKLSNVRLQTNRKSRISLSRKLPSSRGAVVQHGKHCDYETEGKIVYRHLKDGDIVLVNRQPTLHKPSIMAHVVRVLKGEKTIRMHYANCSTYNADFDGDEMNVHFPQDEISRAEAYNIVNANNQYVKPTSGEPIRALIQDHIISAVLLTKKDTFLRWDEFNQLLYSSGLSTIGSNSFSEKFGRKGFVLSSEDEIVPLLPAIMKPEPLWTGKQVITALLNHITKGFLPFTVEKDTKVPRDFFNCKTDDKKLNGENETGKAISKKVDRPRKQKDADKDGVRMRGEPDEDKLFIYKNNFVRGVIDKAQFGEYGLVHTVQELYGSNTAGILLSALSRLFTVYLQMHGFTCGVDDLLLLEIKDRERKKLLDKCDEIGEEVHRQFVKLKDDGKIDPMILQFNIEKTIRSNGEAALAALDRKMISQLNDKTSKSEELKGLLSKGLYKLPAKNCISLMTTSGAKGGAVNFQQISSHLGQQELEGKRVPRMVSGKTLPCFPPWDWTSRSGGLIIDRFLSGLHPQEYYFHCMAGREGLVDTAVKTSRSGYLQRCLIKNLEGLKVCYDYTVRDADGSIIQFCYGEDGVDVHQTSFIANFEAFAANKEMIYKKSCRQIDKSNPYIKDLPSALREKTVKFLQKMSLRQNPESLSQNNFLKLMEHKYLSSLAQPGEPVGVLAAQSVGEPSTQMTLNTFHLAGRGEMNVTLGIPRLQEILMTAANDIKTPFMTCPLHEGRSEEDARRLADKLKKITVADIIESMKVTVEPFSLQDSQICRIYKLELKLYKPEHYPKYADGLSQDWEETLCVFFVRALEDAIENHISLLKKIRGIKDFKADLESKASDDMDKDISGSESQREEEGDDDGEHDEGTEDLGLDARKQKQQATDEMDYDDDSEEEVGEGNRSAGFDIENDEGESGETDNLGAKEEASDSEHGGAENEAEFGKVADEETPEGEYEAGTHSELSQKETKSTGEKKRNEKEPIKKKNDRAIYVEAEGFHFEVHFRFTDEPHILLAQIAQKTATKVYIQNSGKVDHCQPITCKENQVIYYGRNHKTREDISLKEKEKIPALQTAGINFRTFYELQDVLDTRYIYSNNIHAMLNTYGVEAARETIIREITNVFKSYGISVNIRHLQLIAEFMTFTGAYRPMNRHGGIADSVSPLSKMSFETASKFIVEAAYHAERDDLETPSARICLGLPVKVGTGSFDLLQKVEF
ncbi:hypothetical protein FNV43_RR16498 [Rhamnella rubrinervis]|uniref:DNA-directed RNA polymerase subunit n=1 Tax=Rhamnella rubrinervis TaxID=2594499 RepID=A0A8K0MD63_9ROSA|nr:hypothetical protein FNV43_RR16498 [Rhamnella rubrinervis]